MESNEYKGQSGVIVLESDALILTHRKSILVPYKTGVPRRIPFPAISDVRITKANALSNGLLTLGVGGSMAPQLKSTNWTEHPETVMFTTFAQKRFQELFEWLSHVVDTNRAHGIDPAAFPYDVAVMKAEEKAQEKAQEIEQRAQNRDEVFPGVTYVGSKLSDKAAAAITRQSVGGDSPWLILVSSGAAGVLAAWDDRLAIIKTGALTSLMAGSFGGERAATFHFTDITAIEYNSGMFNGVLEILTPSYQGTQNKDFWRGTSSSRNANSNDPWTLSNTLPLAKIEYQAALSQISELRRRIGEAKRPVVHVHQTDAPRAVTLVDQLKNLAELHVAGVLSDDEFASAKARLLT